MSQISKVANIFVEFARDYPSYFLSLFLFLLLEGIVAAGTVLALIPMADYLLDPTFSNPSQITSLALDYFSYFHIEVDFWTVGLLFVGFNLLNGLLKVGIRYKILRIKYAVLRGIIGDSLTAFFKARWEFFTSSSQGELLNTLNKELPVIGDTLGHIATQLSQIVQFLIYISIPFWLDARMTITALILVLIFGVPFLYFNRYSYRLGKENTRTSNLAMGILSEIFQSIRIILGFGRQNNAKLNYLHAFDQHINVTLKSQTLTTAIPVAFAPLGMLAAVVALGVSLQHQSPISELAAVMWSLLSALPILSALLQTNVSINNFIPSYEQLQSQRDRANQLSEIEGDKVFEKLKNGIFLRNVSFTYPSCKDTISEINIQILKGEMTALVGESGSGKSTVTDLIIGLQIPDKGSVFIDDISLDKWIKNTFRKRIGYVPQEPVLFYSSIRDNLLWSCSSANEDELWDALKMANADKFVKQLPLGIDTLVGERGVRMSGGQRQRIALARALLRKPDLLILDEATSSLDSESESLIQSSIEKLANNMTILIVAHRLSTIKKANKVYVMKNGKVVEEGPYQELSTQSNTVFYNMLHKQQPDIE